MTTCTRLAESARLPTRVMIVLVLAAFLGGRAHAQPAVKTVRGTVRGPDNKPLKGAYVKLDYGRSGEGGLCGPTEEDGRYSLEINKQKPFTLDAWCPSKPELVPPADPNHFSPSEEQVIHLVLVPPANSADLGRRADRLERWFTWFKTDDAGQPVMGEYDDTTKAALKSFLKSGKVKDAVKKLPDIRVDDAAPPDDVMQILKDKSDVIGRKLDAARPKD
jgi:hypothetical protein